MIFTMKGKNLWIVILYVMKMVTCMFFHEPSYREINGLKGQNQFFGYSLGYLKHQKKLVLGSPNGAIGGVYPCPLTAIFSEIVSCGNITEMESTFNNSLKNVRRATDDYKFMLGATIAALNDSFVTCAPMWSGEYSFINSGISEKDFFVWGACFEVKDNGTVTPLSGLYGHPRTVKSTKGSFGWRTLVDDTNNLLLISKPASPALHGDIAYVNIQEGKELGPLKSLVNDEFFLDAKKTFYQNKLGNHRNLGNALAMGNFWHMDSKTIVYAFGFTNNNLDGGVMFLEYERGRLVLVMKNSKNLFQLDYSDDMGLTPKNTMFGAALCGARLYGDRYTDLVVGAPTQHGTAASDPELGAIHIYQGSFKKEDFVIRKLTIMSVNEESRFGSSIVANDLDGDGLQELFVSAPYQDDGVLYVLSGYEISRQIKDTLDVSALEYKQIIKKEGFKRLGFSVVALSDLDDNGCDEIAIGAPESNKVMILRCIPTVTIIVTTELVGPKIVPETVNEFQIKVCLNMDYESSMKKIAGNVLLENSISGTTQTRGNITCDPTLIKIDISSKENMYCRVVNVSIVGNELGLYKFKSEAILINDRLEKKEFNESWVRSSLYSIMSKTQLIERGCSGEDCFYSWKMDFLWSGGEIKEGYKYRVGSMKDEVLTLRITNEGRTAFTACALVNVVGAPVDQLHCSHNAKGYSCQLPERFMNNTSHDIPIQLKMSELTNEYTGLNVTVDLFDDCDEKNSSLSKQFYVDYELITDKIEIQGASETRSITEKSMKTSSETIDVTHVYRIKNKGAILWKAVALAISIDESSFVKELVVTSEKLQCNTINQSSNCTFDLIPSSTMKVVVTALVWKKEIEQPLLDNVLRISSNLSLSLVPTSVIKNASATSIPVYEKDSTFGQNMTVIIMIAVLIAIILFAVVIYILYRLGFFRRKQKEELQAEIRRRSVKRSNATSQHENSLIELNDDEINDDDEAFLCVEHDARSSHMKERASKGPDSKKMGESENTADKGKSVETEDQK